MSSFAQIQHYLVQHLTLDGKFVVVQSNDSAGLRLVHQRLENSAQIGVDLTPDLNVLIHALFNWHIGDDPSLFAGEPLKVDILLRLCNDNSDEIVETLRSLCDVDNVESLDQILTNLSNYVPMQLIDEGAERIEPFERERLRSILLDQIKRIRGR
jgi:hypothetical protein